MIEKIKKNYFVLIVTFLLLYFFFNLLDGERGLISLIKKENLLNKLKVEEKHIKNNIEDLEKKNSLLSNNLDPDYVEILIREKFSFVKEGESTYIIKKNGQQN
tara:strand:+ start:441 stop:749 length:309 start_codon:yes stop_codon:yes gene_type:complete